MLFGSYITHKTQQQSSHHTANCDTALKTRSLGGVTRHHKTRETCPRPDFAVHYRTSFERAFTLLRTAKSLAQHSRPASPRHLPCCRYSRHHRRVRIFLFLFGTPAVKEFATILVLRLITNLLTSLFVFGDWDWGSKRRAGIEVCSTLVDPHFATPSWLGK